MQTAIGYLRVSTQEQGRSGLGLAARVMRSKLLAREGFAVKSWHQDVQTSAGADALLLRPGLATALKEAKSARCPLIVSRLDRLSRNVRSAASSHASSDRPFFRVPPQTKTPATMRAFSCHHSFVTARGWDCSRSLSSREQAL